MLRTKPRRLWLLTLLLLLIAAPAWASDLDGDGLEDEWELSYFMALADQDGGGDPDGDGLDNETEEGAGTDPTEVDTDGDGIDDATELWSPLGLDPTNMDTDGDFLSDGAELQLGTDPTAADTDGDGLTDFIEVLKGYNPTDPDTDQGGVQDGEEVLVDHTDPGDPSDDLLDSDNDGITNYNEGLLGTNPFMPDSDGDWISDGDEDVDHDGLWEPGEGETNPADPDTDNDGLDDGWEILVYESDPFDADTDGDGLLDGEEHELLSQEGYECIDPIFADSDFDGLSDGEEVAVAADSLPCLPDSDGGGVYDIVELYDGTDPMDPEDDAADTDGDGLSDVYEQEVTGTNPGVADTDGDGLDDGEEHLPLDDHLVTDPLDADTDDDGLLDGSEGGVWTGKGTIYGPNPTKTDSDNDGLNDGLEEGLPAPEISPDDPDATDLGVFQADQDPGTTTQSRNPDSDGDLLFDGTEDANHNGLVDPGETDPNIYDTDGDGIDDGWESRYKLPEDCTEAPFGPLDPLDPNDAAQDNDGDGLTNFEEYQLIKIVLGQVIKNQTDPCDPDTDGDGLSDGLEVHANYSVWGPFGHGSDPNSTDTDGDGTEDGIEDANGDGSWLPLQETNPLQPDTDGDGLMDGAEDANHDGVVDPGETDPLNPDTDGDGLSDGEEVSLLGTDPLAPDTDGDGLGDGLEVGKAGDADPGSKTNPHEADTDGDGLTDGQEDADHDGAVGPGETDPLDPDTDGDKISDGVEDANQDGLWQPEQGETDPLDKDSDDDGLWDSHEDKDKDGVLDPGETDPNEADTDGGGVDDGTEVFVDGTDPLDPLDDFTADPDGDGLINAVENAIGTDPLDPDSDGDTIPDGYEVGPVPLDPPDSDGDGAIDALDEDSDDDGIPDAVEAGDVDPATDPVDSDGDGTPDYLDEDSDDDGIPDAVEWLGDKDLDGVPDPDADGDGTYNHLDEDSDDDGKLDAVEGTGDQDKDNIPNYLDPNDDDGPEMDSDGDGLTNEEELQGGTNPFNPDTDGDGLGDLEEVEGPTDPLDADSDDDGLPDGADGLDDDDDDGLVNALDPDSDDDGVFDGTERGITEPWPATTDTIEVDGEKIVYQLAGTDEARGVFEPDLDPATLTDHNVADTDGDGVDDGAEDPNHNGRVDFGESAPDDASDTLDYEDLDGDGLSDDEEILLGVLSPDGDMDDDGLADGLEHNWRVDTDGDGLANWLDPDSDGDGLPDGLEEGLVVPGLPEWTHLLVGNFRADADPTTRTRMLIPDTDGGGAPDGLEDLNLDGAVGNGEGDPLDSSDDGFEVEDQDLDGLPDAQEVVLGTDPLDPDSDDDGIADGNEVNWSTDTDLDGLIAALDPDSDNDGLVDGTEVGLTVAQTGGTDPDAEVFIPDVDPSTTTSPAAPDTDGDGVSDGSEDTNKDGAVDPDEGDPLDGTDEAAPDSDDDGLSDAEELAAGLDLLDRDTDDDGVADGDEHNWNLDTDGDGVINALDPDSDGDGLPDGLELGVTVPIPITTSEWGDVVLGTDPIADAWVPDMDPTRTTWMLVVDSDRGGEADGAEDMDGDGAVGPGETDPADPSDDGQTDPDIDGDGIPNDVETEIGTDPFNADSDGDTIPDGVEVGDDLENPLDSDNDGVIDALDEDSDDDSIPDAVEAGDDDPVTDPVDSDGDGLPDYLDWDSDADGLTDSEEANVYGTDPTNADTDGGGADDWLETQVHSSNPKNPADDWLGWLEPDAKIQGGAGCGAAPAPVSSWSLLAVLAALLLLRGRRAAAAALAVVLLLAPAAARADFHPDATNASISGNLVQPTFDDSGVFSVHGGDIAEHLEVRGILWTQGLSRPLVVTRDGTRLRTLLDDRYELGVAAAMGFLGWFEAGVAAPFVVHQSGQYAGQKLGAVATAGMGDMQLFLKGRVIKPEWFGLGVAISTGVSVPTGDAGAYMGLDGVGWRSDLVLYGSLGGDFRMTGNLGYLVQPRTSLFNLEDDDKLILGLGAEYAPPKWFEAGIELVHRASATRPYQHVEEVGIEAIAAGRFKWKKLVVFAGAGAGLAPGYQTPAWRWFAGVGGRHRPNPDRDGDGIPNITDRCPDQPEDPDGFKDKDGCPDPDNDGDGILDPVDKCPNDPEDKDYFEDEDGCPDPDNDGDGIPDEDDQCPRKAEDMDGFEDEDGCPDPDNDGDGILDPDDNCPLEKETFNGFEDEDGCPDKVLAEYKEEGREIKILEKIHFKFMSSEIMEASHPLLDQVVLLLKNHPEISMIQIEGHTDKTGPGNLNMEISRARASSVLNYIVERGIDRGRLQAKGYGWTRLIDYRSGPEANHNNRRVEFKVLRYASDLKK